MTGKTVAGGTHLLAHGAGIGDDPLGPFQYPLAFRREALVSRPPHDQTDAELVLELPDRRRQGRLRDPALVGCPPEMLLACECYEEFQLVDHALPSSAAHTTANGTAQATKKAARKPPFQNKCRTLSGRQNGLVELRQLRQVFFEPGLLLVVDSCAGIAAGSLDVSLKPVPRQVRKRQC